MVANKTPGPDDFIVTRIFDAPRERVWRAWTDPKHVAQWWGPRAATILVCELDVRPGGKYRIVMRCPEGFEYPMFGVYVEVIAPERMSYTVDFAEHPREWHDKFRQSLPAGVDLTMGQFLNTIIFEDVGGKTKVTVRMTFDAVAIRDAMLKMGMNFGLSESLDRLAELLPNF
jgi:uncharacterized protein YndB with AHSA1/START domain